MDALGKETAVTRVTERTKPTLITIGKRQIISSGRWNNECIADFVLTSDRDRWITIGELARVAYGQNTPRSKERVRQCLHQLFKHFLRQSKLLVTEYGPPRNRAIAVKLYSHDASPTEQQSMVLKLERMRKRSVITAGQYEDASKLLHVPQEKPRDHA